MNKILVNSINKFKNFSKSSSSFISKSSSSSSKSFDLEGFSNYIVNGKGTCLIDAEGRYFIIKRKRN